MKKLIALAMSLTAIVPLTAAPAQAATAGAVAFTCTATLPEFPSPGNSGSCSGLARATGAGVTTDFGGWVVTGAGTFEADFQYSEGCVTGGIPPVQGSASGNASVDGLVAVRPGGATAPASVDLTFNWNRTGTVAQVNISNAMVTIDGVGSSTVSGRAVAAFVPVLQGNNACPQGGPLTAQVAGVAELGV